MLMATKIIKFGDYIRYYDSDSVQFAVKFVYLQSRRIDGDVFLIRFFRNLLLGENNVLSNREMHISNTQSLTLKSQNDTLDCTLEEMAILRFLQTKPDARQEEIARHIGKSLSTVKRITPSLIERGLLARENGRRNGRWVIKEIKRTSDKGT